MNRENLARKVGETSQDNLIAGPYPRALTTGVKIANNQSVLPRGSVLSLDEESGLYTLLGAGGKANCVLADTLDTGSVPADQPGQKAELVSQYAAEYAKAGITVEGGKIVYKPTGDIDKKITHQVGNTTYVYVGLVFDPPAGAEAKSVIIKSNGEILKAADGSDEIKLEKDSDDVIGGKPVVYFSVADASGTARVDKTFDLTFTWKGADGAVCAATSFTAARFSGDGVTGVVYIAGCFNRNALVMADGYNLTIKDREALRNGGIILTDMMPS